MEPFTRTIHSENFIEFRDKILKFIKIRVFSNRSEFLNHLGQHFSHWVITAYDEEKVLHFAKENGYDITNEEAEEIANSINEYMDELYRKPYLDLLNELIDESLSNIFSSRNGNAKGK